MPSVPSRCRRLAEAMERPSRPSLIERLTALLAPEPDSREDVLAVLQAAGTRNVLDADVLAILEAAINIADIEVADVMVPRAQMDCIDIADSIERIAAFVVETGHSRFPVLGEGKDDVLGILLAKDLLRPFAGHGFDLRSMLRPAVFVPESKRLNVLLREFRVSHNHLAIVIDEYGGVAGLVTIEDVLEQIVGDIEDEYDHDDVSDNIRLAHNGRYRVNAATALEDFNQAFATTFADDEYESIGGMLMRHFGRLPRRGDVLVLEGLRFQVLHADSRRLHSLLVEVMPSTGARAADIH